MSVRDLLNRLILLSLLIGLFACKKELNYPEDPKKTKASPEKRLEGKWKIYDYTFNGNSIYGKLNAVATGNTNLDKVMIYYQTKKSDNYDQGISELRPFANAGFGLMNERFNLSISTSQDSLFSYWFITPFRFSKTLNSTWTVTKLYDNEFKIVLPTDSGEYKIHWYRVSLNQD